MPNSVLLYGHNTSSDSYHAVAMNSSNQLEVDMKNASLAVTNSDLGTLAGTVSGSEIQVDVVSQPALSNSTDSVEAHLSAVDAANLASIDTSCGNIPGNGQASMDNSLPVVIASDQSNLTVDLGSTDNAVLDSIVAKLPSLGTAGNASANVLSVQGISSMTPLSVSSVASTGNGSLWSAASVNANDKSSSFNKTDYSRVTIMGNTDGSGFVNVEYSGDDSVYYTGGLSINPNGSGDFVTELETGAPYIRLSASETATITAVAHAIH